MILLLTSTIMTYMLILLAMAFYTLLERKILGYLQLRKGPNKVLLLGLTQPFADAIKLFVKEQTKPNMINKTPFMIIPTIALLLALIMWMIYPHSSPSLIMMFGVLYFLSVSSLNVYSTFLAGWCSNSKYSLLGSLRSIAQTISYEISMSLILLTCLIIHHSMNMNFMNMNMMSWIIILIFPMSILWFITNLAETNRTPFDLTEGESELVSGFNTEYSSTTFAMIFMTEYMNILFMSMLSVTFFIGSSPLIYIQNFILPMSTMLFASLFVWVRGTMPRIRYDKLMYLTWKCFLPMTLSFLIMIPPTMIMLM